MFTPEGTKEGRSRAVDVELNLVPFIDLMSTCISFLLITAVWTQVSMIQIGSSIYGKKTDTGQIVQTGREQMMLKLDVTNDGYNVSAGKQSFRIPKANGEYDQDQLVIQLKVYKSLPKFGRLFLCINFL